MVIDGHRRARRRADASNEFNRQRVDQGREFQGAGSLRGGGGAGAHADSRQAEMSGRRDEAHVGRALDGKQLLQTVARRSSPASCYKVPMTD